MPQASNKLVPKSRHHQEPSIHLAANQHCYKRVTETSSDLTRKSVPLILTFYLSIMYLSKCTHSPAPHFSSPLPPPPQSRQNAISPQEPLVLPSARHPSHPSLVLTCNSTEHLACFCVFHAHEFTQCVLFCVLLLWTSIMLVKFIHVVCIVVDQRFSTFFVS